MLRLAVPLVLLLLTLFGGAVWLIGLEPQPLDPSAPAAKQEQAEKEARSEPADSILKDTAEALAPGKPDGDQPSFDIARINPEGTSVFAGRAEPNTYVKITADGAEIGTAQVDENGEWTFTTEQPISNPDAKLALFRAAGPAPVEEKQPPQTASSAPAKPAVDPGAKTAGAVTSNLLKNLEGMVAEARDEKQQRAAAAAGAAPDANAPTSAPSVAGEAAPESAPSVEAPEVAANEPVAPTLPEPSTSPRQVTEPPRAAQIATATGPLPSGTQPSIPATEIARPATSKVTVPVPVTFIFNEANLTSEGARAAGLLLEYLKLKDYPRVTLTGHADERGSNELNMALSRERLETVARFLRDGGYQGRLELIPKGKTEPYTGVVRSDFSRDDLYQLDRRVELVITR